MTAKLHIRVVEGYSRKAYAFVGLDACCEKFEEAFYENIIFFGEHIDGYQCLAFEYGINIGHNDYWYGGDFKELVKRRIDYCPFCGEKLEIVVME